MAITHRPQRKKRRINYHEDSEESACSPTPATRSTRRSRRAVTYCELASDEEEFSRSPLADNNPPLHSLPMRSLPRNGNSHETRTRQRRILTSTASESKLASGKERSFARLPRTKPTVYSTTSATKVSKKCPPWQDLEPRIIVQILAFASEINGDKRNAAVQWLLRIGRLSKSFHMAACIVMYSSPPIPTLVYAEGLIDLLRHPQNMLSLNYKTKVHRLEIDVRALMRGRHSMQMGEILPHVPLLRDLRFFHSLDGVKASWATEALRRFSWKYSAEMLDSLDSNNILLHDFEWNYKFLPESMFLKDVHARRCFSGLRAVVLRNFTHSAEGLGENQATTTMQGMVKEGLDCVDLVHLELMDCGFDDDFLASISTTNLRSLNIHRCNRLSSEGLQRCLSKNGASITNLVLTCNQAMDLDYLVMLKEQTPHLQSLRMEFDPTSIRDKDHLLESVLSVRPMWPRSLEHLQITNFRATNQEEVSTMISSLSDVAEDLRYLNHISIKLILDDTSISWRDRARVRSEWVSNLEAAFASNGSLPQPLTTKSEDRTNISKFRARARMTERDMSLKRNSRTLPCHISLVMDNQRPRETQMSMADFVDSERSDDEEYLP